MLALFPVEVTSDCPTLSAGSVVTSSGAKVSGWPHAQRGCTARSRGEWTQTWILAEEMPTGFPIDIEMICQTTPFLSVRCTQPRKMKSRTPASSPSLGCAFAWAKRWPLDGGISPWNVMRPAEGTAPPQLPGKAQPKKDVAGGSYLRKEGRLPGVRRARALGLKSLTCITTNQGTVLGSPLSPPRLLLPQRLVQGLKETIYRSRKRKRKPLFGLKPLAYAYPY